MVKYQTKKGELYEEIALISIVVILGIQAQSMNRIKKII